MLLPRNSNTTTIVFTNNQECEHQLLANHFHTGITSSTMTKTITQVNLQLDNLQGTMELLSQRG